MEIIQTGIVLKTENYTGCRDFYRDQLKLPILFVEDHDTWNITCFKVGYSYLLVETGGKGSPPEKSYDKSPMKIRINVVDLDSAVVEIRERGIDTSIKHHEWGKVAEFCDPDGNRIALRKHSKIYSSDSSNNCRAD